MKRLSTEQKISSSESKVVLAVDLSLSSDLTVFFFVPDDDDDDDDDMEQFQLVVFVSIRNLSLWPFHVLLFVQVENLHGDHNGVGQLSLIERSREIVILTPRWEPDK